MPSDVHELKHKLKFAPRMGRQLRAEYVLVEVDAPPRRLSPEVLQKIRGELGRLSQSTNPRVRQFVAAMRERYPGVCA
jgi:hypothetical protein